ncbi:unnamed protein product [Caenorhabditis angaria]|uniref:G-protein coupled receptors family 1 profile domain-containing protein n=1 Tax=Caenorhabditis angaria TaxID=860376 RepID=A0A9P1N496_9PELO|nr:unnamed protein product [Caenorhabditis angaria]
MNISEYRSVNSFFIWKSFVFYHYAIIIIYALSVFIIFPIFVHFTKINREKDEQSSIYAITHHLYKITVVSQFTITLTAVSVIIVMFFLGEFEKIGGIVYLAYFIVVLSIVILYIFNQIVVPIQNLLIFLLALQRFLLYFYPNSEKYIVPSEKRFNVIMKWLYFISISASIFNFITKAQCVWSYLSASENISQCSYSIIVTVIYITLDLLVIFSSIFYICILISVRKITSMASEFMKTRPEKAILYQTLVLIIVKLLSVPLVIMVFIFITVGFEQTLTTNTVLDAVRCVA